MKSTNYSEKVLDHFRNPRNVGTLSGENVAYGRVGNPVCGDLMDMYIKVENNRIVDIKFQTFGCGSAVATSSMITEMVKGMTLDKAMKVTRKDVADELDGLPPIKMHCSNLAADALHEAIKNYRKGLRVLEDQNIGNTQKSDVSDITSAPPDAGKMVENMKKALDGKLIDVQPEDYTPNHPESIENYRTFLGKGIYLKKDIDNNTFLNNLRILIIDRGDDSARLALQLQETSPRIVFLTHKKALDFEDKELKEKIKRSDIKVILQGEVIGVDGEGDLEKVIIHDLDENDEYELFMDALII